MKMSISSRLVRGQLSELCFLFPIFCHNFYIYFTIKSVLMCFIFLFLWSEKSPLYSSNEAFVII